MLCATCDHENRDQARFCEACGAALVSTCGGCGTALRAGARFCDSCGTPVAANNEASERAARAYAPKHIADKILRAKSTLEGERKQVTVLFVDVRSSMELSRELGPEQWHGVLDRFFQILAEGVHRFEGTVNQYTGDGIMALFGAPIAHEDHAPRACYSALHLRDELRELTRAVKRRHGVDFAVRIGLNSGDVVVGTIGDDLRMDYTALGHTVGLAQRMEALAAAGAIYLSAHTARLVAGYFETEDLGAFTIKGVEDEQHVFELTGAGDARTRFDLSRARGLTRFVGREDEMTFLETTLTQALAGPGRTLGVVAQAGTGKSRICHEFVEECRRRGLTVYQAQGLAHGKQLARLPILQLMRAFFGIAERESARVQRERIAGRLLLLDPSLAEELPILFDLLGVSDPEYPLPRVDAEVLQRRLLAAIRTVVRLDGERELSVLVVEDLHWLDPASDAILEHIIEANAESRGLVLVNFRPEYQARWMTQSYYQRLPLLPLSSEALTQLLRDLLGDDPSVRSLPAAIHARTGGNPFFIEEMVQSLVDDGHLHGRRGAYTLMTPVEALPVPASVRDILAARIDRLPKHAKHVLQTAAVIGKNFRERLLAKVVEFSAGDLAESLRVLQDGEFLYEATLYPEREYAFKHPLTQEVANGSQLATSRVRAHAGVARALEHLEVDRLDEHAALLAYHWERAEDPERAVVWYARAGDRAWTTNYEESRGHWLRVNEILRTLEPSPAVNKRRIEALRKTLQLAFRTGVPLEVSEELFAEGRSLLDTAGSDQDLAWLLNALAALKQSAGDLPGYLELGTQAMAAARRAKSVKTQIEISLDGSYALQCMGRLAESLAASDAALALIGDDATIGVDSSGYSLLLTQLSFSGSTLASMGRVEEGRRRSDEAFRRASADTPPETLGWLRLQRIEIDLLLESEETAVQGARRCLDYAERSGSVFDAVAARMWVPRTLVAASQWREAVDLLESGIALGEARRTGLDVVNQNRWLLPHAYLGIGDLDRARDAADVAIAVSTAQQAQHALCRSHVARAAVRRVDPSAEPGAAARDLDRAEELVAETGARIMLPFLAEARARLVSGAERARLFEEARRLFVEMGATAQAARIAREVES